MLEGIKTYLHFGNKYCGIEHSNVDGKSVIVTTLLRKHKNEIELDKEFEAFEIYDVVKSIPQKQHAFLVVNDENVLSKSVESDQRDCIKLVLLAFPNINLDEFYFEVLSQDYIHFISLCRRSVVDDIVQKYKDYGISIVNFSLGNILAVSVKRYVSSLQITTSNAHLIFENSMLKSIQIKTVKELISYDVNGLESDSLHLLSLAGALDSIIHQNSSFKNFDDEGEKLLNEHMQSRIFDWGLKSSAIAILMILLVNFLIFNHYHNRVAILEQKLQSNQSTLDQITGLSAKVNNVQKMVEEVFMTSGSRSSFFIDAIVRCQPKSILLDRLDFQPLKKKAKEGKLIDLDENVMVVSGESTSSDSFSQWLIELEDMPWIDQIGIQDYKDVSPIKSIFQIKIEMNDH